MAVDLEAAIERYTKLGFVAAGYRDTPTSPPVYAFVCFGPGEFHIASVNHVDPKTTTSACYLWVEDADAVHASWAAADVEGRLHAPRDTSYGMREMAYVDPDGNLVRVGSPMHPDP